MNYTDTQLKQTLAKMLPEMLIWDSISLHYLNHGAHGENIGDLVDDACLLHLCWLVEQRLQAYEANQYGFILDEQSTSRFVMVHATWQSKVIALCKVKGIMI